MAKFWNWCKFSRETQLKEHKFDKFEKNDTNLGNIKEFVTLANSENYVSLVVKQGQNNS